MVKENYLLYLEQTVLSYSNKVKQHLVKRFLDEKIVVKDSTITGQIDTNGEEAINIFGMGSDEVLSLCIRQNDRAVKEIEKWEFVKDYRYSAIFTCNEFEDVVEKIKTLDVLEDLEKDYLYSALREPVYYRDEKREFLKFNLSYAAVHPATREEVLLKYPILVVFHRECELVEVRYDVLKKVFVLDQDVDSYTHMIDSVVAYIQNKFMCTLEGLDLNYMIGVTKHNDDIKLIAQYMKFSTGQYAQLEVGNNQEYMLPLIGELQSILLDHKDDLEKVPELKDTLEQFLFEKEEMSDYPWIEVLWENEIKTRSIHVKFVFTYMGKSYGQIQHYYNNVLVGMERMNYVVEYIASNRNNSDEKTESTDN